MEDGLRVLIMRGGLLTPTTRLNPCFNGRWSARQYSPPRVSTEGEVLILVLMEDGLRAEQTAKRHAGRLAS